MNLNAFFPFLALALGTIVSIYLFAEWFRHGRRPRFLLFWAGALFLMYWFQIPVMLSNLGRVITVTDFNLFFALTFPITFLALMLIYLGVLEVCGFRLEKKSKFLLSGWFFLAILFFAYNFIINEGVIKTHLLPLVGNIAFYLPIRVLIIVALARWLSRTKPKTMLGILGAWGIIGESALGFVRNFMVLKTVLVYPPQFWYVALSSMQLFFILQTLSIILAALGFYFLHRAYYRTRDHVQG